MEPKETKKPGGRRRVASLGLVLGGLVAGATLAGTHLAGAQGTTSSATPPAASQPAQGGMNPATITHGPGETLLTGDTAAKVKAAALKAVPGGTVIRVETDSAGSPYEAHVRKSDGSYVTVKVDSSFNVTSTQSGFGAGGPKPSGSASGSGGTNA